MAQTATKKTNGLGLNNKNEKLFYALFIAVPVIHFLVFYVYINFNSILLAFQEYTLGEGGYEISFVGVENFKVAFQNAFEAEGWIRIKNTLLMFIITLCIGTPLAILFSYYLYKKAFLSGFFKVILFMPQLLSGVVLGILFKQLTSSVYIDIFGDATTTGLLTNPETKFKTVLVFNLLMCFGVNVLTYTSTMSGVNESLIESAQLDGATSAQELWHIVLPMIYPTVTTLFIVSFSHLFTEQYHLYTLFGTAANEMSSVGYFLYVQAQSSALSSSEVSGVYLNYPTLSAMGLIFTAIILPTTLIIRDLLEKHGPSAD